MDAVEEIAEESTGKENQEREKNRYIMTEENTQKSCEWKGSITVEASFLLPLIVYLIWNCVFLSFFVYDQCIVMQGSYCSALGAERLVADDSEKKVMLEEKYRETVENRKVMCSISTEKELSDQKIVIDAGINMKAPGGRFFFSNWRSEQHQAVEKFEPVAFIRMCRKAENLIDFWNAGKTERESVGL